MKHYLLALASLLPFLLFSQVQDSIAAVHEVENLLQACQDSFKVRRVEKAFHLIEQAKENAQARFGELSPAYAKCLHIQADLLIKQRKFKEAEPFCLHAKEIREKVLDKYDPDYALSVNYLGALNRELGYYDKAEQLALQAEEIRAIKPGKNSREYAITLHLLGSVYHSQGKYKKAESYYLEAKSTFIKCEGKGLLGHLNSLRNLIVLYNDWGQYDKMEAVYLELESNNKTSADKDSLDLASGLNSEGLRLLNLGRYHAAEQCLIQAKKLYEKLLGKNDEVYVYTLINLSKLYLTIEEGRKAESYLLGALDILKDTIIGKENRTYIATLINLGALYYDIGQDDKSKSVYLEARPIIERVFGKNHPFYATCLTNLGNLSYLNGNYDEADTLFETAKDIRYKTLGNDNPEYAASLNNIAELYLQTKRYAEAEPLLVEAKEIWLRKFGENNQFLATSIHNLARLFISKGDFEKADSLLTQAKNICETALIHKRSRYLAVITDLAKLRQQTNRPLEASRYFLETNELIRHLVGEASLYLSENEMLAFIQTHREVLNQFQSFAQRHPSPALIGATYDNALFYNGYLLENTSRLERFLANTDSLTRDTVDRWQGCKRSLAYEYTQPIVDRRTLEDLETEAEGYEKALTRYFADTLQVFHWQDIRSNLKAGEAAIEFIHYPYYNPNKTDSVMYVALILLPGETAGPYFVPLCEQKPLENLLRIKYADKRYERNPRGHSLYELLWRPMERLLIGTNTIYYAPSGLLHYVNLDAIMLDLNGDSTLIDRYKLVRLGSTRQLTTPVRTDFTGNNALLFGGINYEPDSVAIATEIRKIGMTTRGDNDNELLEPCDNLQNIVPFGPLPNTLKEVENISRIVAQKKIKSRVFSGFRASEEVFKHVVDSMSAAGSSPRILHFATHGYYSCQPQSDERTQKSMLVDQPAFKISMHPFLRSGLLLAGGNHAWVTGKPCKTGMEDGILTAYEISAMSFQNTELVVLSACESGLGDLNGDEGVYGLQRAFKIAGAQYLIMSLWDIPDDITLDLMTIFYQNWLKKGMDIPGAFHSAQLEMKKKNKDPDRWAGLVLVR